MAVSDEIGKLTVRAKEAQTRAAAARDEAKADLERDISAARASSQARAEKLREQADAGTSDVSSGWAGVQNRWNEHIATVRADMDSRKAEHDVARSQRRAEVAEDEALYAIDFALAAIEEAEYTVLDATLARMDSDELATAGSRT